MTKKNLTLFIAVVALGIFGGVIGGILVRSYLLNTSFDIPLFGDINVGGRYREGSLVISQPKNVIVEQDERVAGVIAESAKSIVALYKKKAVPDVDADEAPSVTAALLAARYYAPPERIGTGLVVTSDGWIMTAASVTPAATLAITHDGVARAAGQVVSDERSGYSFVKLDARNLAAARFAERDALVDGQLVIALDGTDAVVTRVTKARFDTNPAAVKSSEALYQVVRVGYQNAPKGTIITGLNGAIVGLYEGDGMVIPMYRYAQLLSGLLREAAITRPALGAHYIGLHEFAGPETLTGALLAGNGRNAAVAAGSPAAVAGLAAGDIIMTLDGRGIDAGNTLSELVAARQPGDEISLLVQRAGEEIELTAVLGTQD